MKERSIWKDSTEELNFDELKKDMDTDVLIIGGGITGVSTAYNLIHKGLRVCLVERKSIGSAVTSKSTAKITILQENIYSKLKSFHGKKKALLYYQSQKEAVEIITNTIHNNNIECDLEKSSSYLYTICKSNIKKVKKEMKLLREFGEAVENQSELPDKTRIQYGFSIQDSYVFHPLKYVASLAEICYNNGIDVYQSTKVTKINKIDDGYICDANGYKIKAKYIVIASHYPYFINPFFIPLKTRLQRSYIKAIPTKENLNFNAINLESPLKSIRYYTRDCHSYKIELSNSHNICVKNNEEKNFNSLIHLDNKPAEYIWSNIDIITNDYLPFIGKMDENIFIGTGYNTWGMTNATIAGVVLSDLIVGGRNPYTTLFDPNRRVNLGKIRNSFTAMFSNMYSFTKSKLSENKAWYSSNVEIKRENGKPIGIYTDDRGKKHAVSLLCPHMKCSLVFNEIEKTWDCPCHGSRFDIDGGCIEGPSNYDISYIADKE